MATTPQQAQQEHDEFAQGYAEDQQKPAEMTEDEAFGLTPDEPAQAAAEPPAVEAAESSGEGEAGDAAAGDPASQVIVAPDAEASGDVPAGDEPTDPKDLQRQKSWEGRLKAREAELKAREDALKAGGAPAEEAPAESPAEMAAEGETPAEAAAEPAVAEKLEEVVAQVETGQITAEQAMQQLSTDFGDDFTKMLSVLIESKASEIAAKTADEKVGAISNDFKGLVGELQDERTQAHFESISDAHPDFMEIGESAEFKDYVEMLPATEKEKAVATIEGGSAKQIAKLLSDYKDSKKAPEEDKPDESSLDNAEGVRGRGMKLPDAPTQSEGYEEAWDAF